MPEASPSAGRFDRWTTPERFLGVAALVHAVFWFVAWPYFGGRNPLHANDSDTLALLGPHEAPFFITGFLFEGVLAAWLFLTLGKRWPARLDELWRDLHGKPGRVYVAFAGTTAAFALVMGLGLIQAHPITEDEKTYLFQAHLLLKGRLSVPEPVGAKAFWQPFVVMPDGHWSGQYPWAQPAALALGVLVGCPWIIPPLEIAVAVYFTARLAEEYTGDPRAGIVAAALAATSPIVVLTAGTLHNANLAAACTAASLWAVVRLTKRLDRRAVITLGLATGVGLHGRPMDQALMMLGCGILLLVHFRGNLRGLVRAIGPAVLVCSPFLALFPILNHLAYGRWSQTGYALFNGRDGAITMGFGAGPFKIPHTLDIALAKTASAFVRVAFYTTGAPIALGLLALPFVGLCRRSYRSLAPIVPTLVFVAGYFFYAASSIDPTGPVYYLALMPLLHAWMAMVAVDLHDAVRGRAWFGRAVPAFLCAQGLAALVVFWPAQVWYLARNVQQSMSCETVLEDAGIKRALVFAVTEPAEMPTNSWYRCPPLSEPPFDAPVLWAQTLGVEEDARTVERFAGDRPVFLETCFAREPDLLRYDPAHRRAVSLDGTRERVFRQTNGASRDPARPADLPRPATSR